MRYFTILCIGLFLWSCDSPKHDSNVSIPPPPLPSVPELDNAKANYLYTFAFDCIEQEYPNKLGQVIGDASYLKSPQTLHPAFYGCFDWHSAVHGHWTLVTLMEHFPNHEQKDEIIAKLKHNINVANITQELTYFDDSHNKNFERTYGWAWLLKLSVALDKWQAPEADSLQMALQPLTDLMEQKFMDFLPKLNYPIRIGEHYNTAYGMSFALEYAQHFGKKELELLLVERAKYYYISDEQCPMTWEPGGFDFLSPCLQEANLMLKVLPKSVFVVWLDHFLPGFRTNPSQYIQPAEVSDRSDGKIVHLDGLNFSRGF